MVGSSLCRRVAMGRFGTLPQHRVCCIRGTQQETYQAQIMSQRTYEFQFVT